MNPAFEPDEGWIALAALLQTMPNNTARIPSQQVWAVQNPVAGITVSTDFDYTTGEHILSLKEESRNGG